MGIVTDKPIEFVREGYTLIALLIALGLGIAAGVAIIAIVGRERETD